MTAAEFRDHMYLTLAIIMIESIRSIEEAAGVIEKVEGCKWVK